MSRLARAVLGLLLGLSIPSVALAQASIAGVVRDTSGAVLPGVTVEAASPALIEKVRSAVTDGSGQYRIVDLRPGAYTVTFTLTGFATVRREGITLSGDVVASVNAELRVGALEETVTVTGDAPIVDVQSTRQQSVIDRDVLAAIPTGRNHYHLAVLIPGMNTGVQDVGGSAGTQVTGAGSIHGATSGRLLADGLTVGHNGESLNMWVSNVGGAQETAITTSGGLGEAETGGVIINVVPREGGNTFTGSVFANFAGSGMQGSNLTDAERAPRSSGNTSKFAGLGTPNSLDRMYDFNPTFGGPIVRDRLWFFATHRQVATYNVVSVRPNLNAGDFTKFTYVPDTTREATSGNRYVTGSVRLTFQATPRNKFNVYWDDQLRCVSCDENGGGTSDFGLLTSPEADARQSTLPNRVYQATWQSPVTDRILLEAGYGAYMQRWGNRPRNDGTYSPDAFGIFDIAGENGIPGLVYRQPLGPTALIGTYGHDWTGIQSWRASMSYVTGAHNVKVGYFGGRHAPIQNNRYNPNGIGGIGLLGSIPLAPGISAPLRIVFAGIDNSYQGILQPVSLYAQDQWTVGRLTLQGGVRYDHIRGSFGGGDQVDVPTAKAGPFLAADLTFSGEHLRGVRYHDITPRMGVAYDVFGTGRTAAKVTLGKYMESLGSVGLGAGSAPAAALSPMNRLSLDAIRPFLDFNGNYFPDCNLASHAPNGECITPWDNQNFGTGNFNSTPNRDFFEGWGKRGYNWEFGANVQQEVIPNVSVNVGYFRRWFGNFIVEDNLAVGPADFDRFSITVPNDPRLPTAGRTFSLLDIKPAKFGVFDNYITGAGDFGTMTRRWHGVDVTGTARFGRLTAQGGASSGTERRDECEIAAKLPEASPTWASGKSYALSPFCAFDSPWLTQVKGLAVYTIPRVEVLVSATLQSIPGNPRAEGGTNPTGLSANVTSPTDIDALGAAASLGRPFIGLTGQPSLDLVEPGTLYGDRTNQLDFRVAKIFGFGSRRVQVGLDVYNLTNTNAIQSYLTTYDNAGNPALRGSSWLVPSSVLTARFFKISGQLDF